MSDFQLYVFFHPWDSSWLILHLCRVNSFVRLVLSFRVLQRPFRVTDAAYVDSSYNSYRLVFSFCGHHTFRTSLPIAVVCAHVAEVKFRMRFAQSSPFLLG